METYLQKVPDFLGLNILDINVFALIKVVICVASKLNFNLGHLES